jgi:hypothetical protein
MPFKTETRSAPGHQHFLTVADDCACSSKKHRRRSAVIPGLARSFSEWYPSTTTTTTTTKAIRALAPASSNWCPGFPSLAATGNFRNGWVVIGPMVRRGLDDNHILTGAVRFFHHLAFSIVIRHLWRWIGAETDAIKTQFTIYLPF